MQASTIYAPPHDRSAMHRHGDLRIVVFLGGGLKEDTFDGSRTFAAGDFVFRPAHFAHSDTAGETGAAYIRLPVSPRAAQRWFARHGWRAGRGHTSLEQAINGDDLLDMASPDAYAPTTSTSSMQRAATWLASDDACRVSEVAQRLEIEPFTLTRRFLAAFGMSPNAYRRQARLQRAIRMVSEDAGSLAQIAGAAGFSDQSHLTTEFRRETGCTPARWRDLIRAA